MNEKYVIKNEQDVIELQNNHKENAVFLCIETAETYALSDFRYNADWKMFTPVTIKYIGEW